MQPLDGQSLNVLLENFTIIFFITYYTQKKLFLLPKRNLNNSKVSQL